MTREAPPPDDLLSRIASMIGLGDRAAVVATLEELERQTRRQLLDWSRRLGLTGVSRLTKDALATRLRQALEALGVGAPGREPAEPPDVARKFDLGRPAETAGTPEQIPWSYGQDRVTAMAVDPDRLYVYWEVTDDGIARARQGLGAGGPGAWLELRVYDVTSRLFDGTNAHGYFDRKVERHDRQWFFAVGKPTSTAVVEIGLKSLEGYFVRIARSGRVDFPREQPAPSGDVEWMTVHAWSGEPVDVQAAPRVEAVPAPAPPAWDEGLGGAGPVIEERTVAGAPFEEHRDWQDTFRTEWREGERTLEWRGPVVRTTWEAGPFEAPVESPAFVEERHEGGVHVEVRNGRRRIVYGPWQVVIRGLGARAERQVVATWELQCTWAAPAGVDGMPGGMGAAPVGASEQGRGASEWRLGGASEVWRIGASEIRFLGASERLSAGASELRLSGASEVRLRGASEWRLGGASEYTTGGASERAYPGASEQVHGVAGESPRVPAAGAPLPYPGDERPASKG